MGNIYLMYILISRNRVYISIYMYIYIYVVYMGIVFPDSLLRTS